MGTEGVICPSPSLRVHPPTAWLPPLSILCAQPCLLLPHVLSQAAHSRPGLLHLPLSSRPDSPGPPPSHSLFCSPDPEGLRADLPSRASAQQPGKAGTYTVVLHTHTDSHMDTHTLYAHSHTHSLYTRTHSTCTQVHTLSLQTYTHTRKHSLHIYTHTCSPHTNTCIHTVYIHTGTYKYTWNTQKYKYIHGQTHRHIHRELHTPTHAYTQAHIYTYLNTYIHIYTHTYTHNTYVHTEKQAQTYTHRHTYTHIN